MRFADAVAAELGSHRPTGRTAPTGATGSPAGTGSSLPAGWGDPTAEDGAQYDHWVPLHDLEAGLRALARQTGVPLKS